MTPTWVHPTADRFGVPADDWWARIREAEWKVPVPLTPPSGAVRTRTKAVMSPTADEDRAALAHASQRHTGALVEHWEVTP